MKIAFIFIISAVALKLFVFKTDFYSIIDDCWGIMGLIVVLIGTMFRSWSAGVIKKNKALTTEGPYHICRNPLYLGSFLIGIGFTIIMAEVYLWIFMLLFITMYIPKIKGEEKYLSKIFPDDFAKYKKMTGIFYPKRLSFKKIACKWSRTLWLKNSEYNCWIAVVLSCVFIEVWRWYLAR
jgi:protein-S-isoprenylcysteine O-methyltransferase Ste14